MLALKFAPPDVKVERSRAAPKAPPGGMTFARMIASERRHTTPAAPSGPGPGPAATRGTHLELSGTLIVLGVPNGAPSSARATLTTQPVAGACAGSHQAAVAVPAASIAGHGWLVFPVLPAIGSSAPHAPVGET